MNALQGPTATATSNFNKHLKFRFFQVHVFLKDAQMSRPEGLNSVAVHGADSLTITRW